MPTCLHAYIYSGLFLIQNDLEYPLPSLGSCAILEKVVYVFHLNTMKMSSVNLSVGIGCISNPWGYDAWCIHDITYITAWTSCYSTGSRGLHTLSTCTPEHSLTHNTAVWPSSVYSVHLEDSDYLDIFGMKLELLTSAQSLPTMVQTVLELFSHCDAMTSRAACQENGFKDS